MAYVITSKCERDGLCMDVCPTDSIKFIEDDPAWPTYYINPDTCIDCASCEAECPHGAIFSEDDSPEADAAAKNAAYFTSGPGASQI